MKKTKLEKRFGKIDHKGLSEFFSGTLSKLSDEDVTVKISPPKKKKRKKSK